MALPLLAALAPGVAWAQTAQTVPQDWALIPSGIQPGESFRLLFVTSTRRNATSSNIANYNTFVQGRANAGHMAIRSFKDEFRAVACTADDNARTNTGVTATGGVPIYWLNGAKVADNYGDFYDGSWNSRTAKLESGANAGSQQNQIFVGCNGDGTSHSSQTLGSSSVSIAFRSSGNPLAGGGNVSRTNTRALYAISPVLRVQTGPPSAPAKPTFGTVTGTSIVVNWVIPADNGSTITGVTLERRIQGQSGVDSRVLSKVNGNLPTTSTAASLTGDTTYEFRVRMQATLDGVTVTSDWSEWSSKTTLLATPGSVTVTGLSDSSIRATWTGVAGADNYDVRYRTAAVGTGNPGNWINTPGRATTATETITDLPPATSYEVSVRAYKTGTSDGASAWSAPTAGSTLADTTPPVLQSATVDGRELVLTYDEPLDESSAPAADRFTVGTTPPGGLITIGVAVSTVAVDGATVTLRLATGVLNGRLVQLSYAVPSANPIQDAAGNDAAGLSTRAVTNNTPPHPDAPAPMISNIGGEGFTVTWAAPNANGGTIDDYNVRYREVTDPPGSWTFPGHGIARTKAITGLARGTEYEVEVRAHNSGGESAWGSARATTHDVPDRLAAPSVRAPQGSRTSLEVRWEAPEDDGGTPITGYGLRYREDGSGTWIQSTSLGPTVRSTTLTGLTQGRRYEVQVRGVNAVDADPANWSASGRGTAGGLSFTSPSAFTFKENRSGRVGRVMAEDRDGNRIDRCQRADAYRLTGGNTAAGADGRYFRVNCFGDLSFRTVPDYENPRGRPLSSSNSNTYRLTVTARHGSGSNQQTASQDITVTVTNVDAPGQVSSAPRFTGLNGSVLNFQWPARPDADGGDWVTGYEIRYSPPGPGLLNRGSTADRYSMVRKSVPAHRRGRNPLSTTLSRLTPNTEYTVWVRAVNSEGAGPWSAPAKGMTAAVPLAPNPSVAAAGERAVRVLWSAPRDQGSAITQYQVLWGLDVPGGFTELADVHSRNGRVAREITLENLEPGTGYKAQVRARNANGWGPWSHGASGVTAGATTGDPVAGEAPVLGSGPSLSGIVLNTPPGAGGWYGTGDLVRIDVEFDGAVGPATTSSTPNKETSTPNLRMMVGSSERLVTDCFRLWRNGAYNALRCRYRVEATDRDSDGLSFPADALVLPPGAALHAKDDASAAAVIAFGPVAAIGAGRVNAAPSPALVGIVLPDGGGSPYGTGDLIRIDVEFDGAIGPATTSDTPNKETSTPNLRMMVGSSERLVTDCFRLWRNGAYNALRCRYRVGATDRDSDGLSFPANALVLPMGVALHAKDDPSLPAVITLAAVPSTGAGRIEGGTGQSVAAPAVVGLPTVSTPQSNGSYAPGEVIEARVRFSAPVTVATAEGVPSLGLAIGGVRRDATYTSGSGSATLTFALTVSEGEAGAGAAKAVANGIRLNGGAISGLDGTTAVLSFGASPGVVAIPAIAGAPGGDGRWSRGETLEVTLTFAEPVLVEGTPTIGVEVGVTARRAAYARGAGTSSVVFSYTLTEADAATSSVAVTANSLALEGGTIRSTGGLEAELAHHGAALLEIALPRLTVAAAQASEGDTLSFGVRLEPAATWPVTVAYATADGTATAGADYTAATGTLTFALGEREKTIPVALLEDTAAEDSETLTLALSHPIGASLQGGVATGTITDMPSRPASGPAPLTAQFLEVPPEHDGQNMFTFQLRFDGEPEGLSFATVRDSLLTVEGGTVTRAKRLTKGSNMVFTIHLQPTGLGDVTVALQTPPPCGLHGAVCTADGRRLAGGTVATIQGPAALSVADAQAPEGPGAVLTFTVTLSRGRHQATTVDYATADGTAIAGADYTPTSGTLTFSPGETSKTVSVPILDDSHDDDGETLTLSLSNPVPAAYVHLADAVATGTIRNDDAIPQAWMARFARTVADQVVDAVQARMETPPTPGRKMVLAGIQLNDGNGQQSHGQQTSRLDAPTLNGADLLASSSFSLTANAGSADPTWSIWGQGALTSFDGREGDLILDGTVSSALLGADWTWDNGATSDGAASADGRWRSGLLLSHSRGEGSYDTANNGDDGDNGSTTAGNSGKVEAHLTGLFPWVRRALNHRLATWGLAGYGLGELTVTPKQPDETDAAPLTADLNLWMVAGGLRGTLMDGGSNGLSITGKTDAMLVASSSAEVTGDDGTLASAEATVTRLRMGLEASRPLQLVNGATLTPSLEAGLRHDGGDAETGFGLDLGGGISLSHPQGGLEAELRGRGLLSHAADGFRDRGFSASLAWRQQTDSQLGAALSLSHTMGGAAAGGADDLLSRVTLDGLATNGEEGLNNQRLEVKLSYGLPAFNDRFTLTPELGLGLYDNGRDYRIGWQLTQPDHGESFAFSFDATRREDNNNGATPEHGVQLGLDTRF